MKDFATDWWSTNNDTDCSTKELKRATDGYFIVSSLKGFDNNQMSYANIVRKKKTLNCFCSSVFTGILLCYKTKMRQRNLIGTYCFINALAIQKEKHVKHTHQRLQSSICDAILFKVSQVFLSLGLYTF